MRGHVRRHRGGWQAMYDLGPDPKTGKRRQRSKSFDAQEAAEDWLAEQVDAVRNRGRRSDPSRITVAEYLDLWLAGLETDDLRQSTRNFYRYRVNKHIKPGPLAAVRLRDLSLEQIRAFYATLPPTVVDKVHATLRRALYAAVESGKLTVNPARYAKRRKRAGGRRAPEMAYWTADELATFLDATADDRLAVLWRLFPMTGLRRGEALGLQWADIDLDAKTVTIRRSLVPEGIEDPKTEAGFRTIDLDAETVRALRKWKHANQNEERLAAGSAWRGGDWVFTNRVGGSLQPGRTSARFTELVKSMPVRRIRLHDTRHTHATLMLRAGVNPKVVSCRLGHSSVAITLDVYAHVMPSDEAEAVALVDQMVDRAREKSAEDG